MRQQQIRDFGKNIDEKETFYTYPKERIRNHDKNN